MTALFLFNAPLGLLVAAVLLRAAWRRRENQLLAVAALLDTGRDAAAGLLLLEGETITSPLLVQVCLVGRILVVYPLLEFCYAFPRDQRPPGWVRYGGLAATIGAAALVTHPASAEAAMHPPLLLGYFLPFFAAIVLVMRHNLGRARAEGLADGVRLVFVTMLLRCALELCTYALVRALLPGLLPLAVATTVVAAMSSYVMCAHSMLRYRLFRVGPMIAESALLAVLALSCTALVVTAAELVASHVQQPIVRGFCFAAIAVIPLAVWLATTRYAAYVEAAILPAFDPRRQLLRTVLKRALHESVNVVDPAALRELTSSATAALSRGTVEWWSIESPDDAPPARVLPRPLAEYLQRALPPTLHRQTLTGLSEQEQAAFASLAADALVTVQAQGTVFGAFTIRSCFLDRDALETATALADNLGTKLAHHALYERAFELQSQLDASRHLATLGSFVAAIAHDIRTPLTSVKLNLEMIRRRPDLVQDAAESADLALEGLRRINDYVSDLLDYVKPVQLRAVEIDLASLVEEAARTLQPMLRSRRLELRVTPQQQAAAIQVRADASRMKQVLLNLLENAADASLPGATIQVATGVADGDQVSIQVIDEGHGITPGNLERIFEPFFTTREEGTGLGLAIVKKLVCAHDGEVRVDSAPGMGSRFTVLLPAGNPLS